MLIRSFILAASIVIATPALACTGISLTTINNNYIQARTIEWGNNPLNSWLIIAPRDYSYTSTMPDQKEGKSWRSKYGFVGISVHEDNIIGEGMNEKGLNAGIFFFKGFGSLKPYNSWKRRNTINDMDFVRWLLSNFATVDEVKAAINDIDLVPIYLSASGVPSPTGHWRVSDRLGNNIVIEIMNDGKDVNIHENEVGVLTNSPEFTWHMTNLNNYINLNPGTMAPRQAGKIKLESLGAGTGFLGLPGDITPPSRFVRASFFVETAPKLENGSAAVSQAFHILNNFDIPLGTEFSEDERSKIPNIASSTQWTAVSDLTGGNFYYKTMNDSQIKRIELDKLDFAKKAETIRDLDDGKFNLVDVMLK